MKTCPVCALDLEDTYLFCPDDGSSLGNLSVQNSDIEPASVAEQPEARSDAVVLYCPACAAEYPLTFSECPVHAIPLTRHRIQKPTNSRLDPSDTGGVSPDQATVSTVLRRSDQSKPKRLTTLDLKRPEIESRQKAPATLVEDDNRDSVSIAAPAVFARAALPADALGGRATAFDKYSPDPDANERAFERPGFRVAAIATAVVLGLFALGALYAFISGLSRRPSSNAVQFASSTQPALPFVATPQAAQDYKEEVPAPAASPAAVRESDRQTERSHNESLVRSSLDQGVHKTTISQPVIKPSATVPPPAPVPAARVSSAQMPPLPRGNSGDFDARLIHVRSRKTTAGFRYDLTFNMQEQAGRGTQWQRVLISTRSASGVNHSEAIPFSHHLGATGALTFTISVEMTGRSEADWQGRIVCTTLGWDNKGVPLQASFGANVMP